MLNRIYVGQWQVWQDSPEYGCTDNPSYNWYANRYVNGHWTGESMGPCVMKNDIMTQLGIDMAPKT